MKDYRNLASELVAASRNRALTPCDVFIVNGSELQHHHPARPDRKARTVDQQGPRPARLQERRDGADLHHRLHRQVGQEPRRADDGHRQGLERRQVQRPRAEGGARRLRRQARSSSTSRSPPITAREEDRDREGDGGRGARLRQAHHQLARVELVRHRAPGDARQLRRLRRAVPDDRRELLGLRCWPRRTASSRPTAGSPFNRFVIKLDIAEGRRRGGGAARRRASSAGARSSRRSCRSSSARGRARLRRDGLRRGLGREHLPQGVVPRRQGRRRRSPRRSSRSSTTRRWRTASPRARSTARASGPRA